MLLINYQIFGDGLYQNYVYDETTGLIKNATNSIYCEKICEKIFDVTASYKVKDKFYTASAKIKCKDVKKCDMVEHKYIKNNTIAIFYNRHKPNNIILEIENIGTLVSLMVVMGSLSILVVWSSSMLTYLVVPIIMHCIVGTDVYK